MRTIRSEWIKIRTILSNQILVLEEGWATLYPGSWSYVEAKRETVSAPA